VGSVVNCNTGIARFSCDERAIVAVETFGPFFVVPLPSLPEDVRRLLKEAIQSVERLDVLLLLRREGRSFSVRSLATTSRMPPARAELHLVMLCGRGFLSVGIGNDLVYSYAPTSGELANAVAQLANIRRDHPEQIEEVLGPAPHDPIRDFAEAFRVRKRTKDDEDG
jgi:hypothetical protein